MENIFNLHYQYELYKKRVGLDNIELPKIQETEMKRAFMGGIGQLLVLFLTDLATLEENEAVKVLDDMKNQVQNFWNNEVNK